MSYEQVVNEANGLGISIKKFVYHYLPKYCCGEKFINYIHNFCKLNNIDILETKIYTKDYHNYSQIFISGEVFKSEVELQKEIKEKKKLLKEEKSRDETMYKILKKKLNK